MQDLLFTLDITMVMAAVCALLQTALAIHVIRYRRGLRISLGDGDRTEVARAIRIHANFAENTPLALILVLLAELAGLATWVVAGSAALFVVGRVMHVLGMATDRPHPGRVIGMASTFAVFLTLAIALLLHVIGGW